MLVVVEDLGAACQPEKRKVGGSTLPLTTSLASGERVAELVKRGFGSSSGDFPK
jgi:hypothetical protein